MRWVHSVLIITVSLTQFMTTETDAGWGMTYFAKIKLFILFCFVLLAADRWRWSLLVVGVMLLISLTVLIFYVLRDSVKSKFYFFLLFTLRVLNRNTRKNLLHTKKTEQCLISLLWNL